MLLLWVVVLGVCGDVALSMEGPRGKVTREMCSKPASEVHEVHWPYCCEGYGHHCEDFAASCYLNCQPVVSSGSDVTMVEERPGFCCALYNFCCSREFSRIGKGNLPKVEAEEQFPTFHRFHIPGKHAPKWSPAPRKNIVRQDVNNDISESPSTINRIGNPRTSSRNNGLRERQDRTDLRSPKSLDVENNDFSSGVSRSVQQRNRFNSQPNTDKPQRSSKPNVVKQQRNQVRFPQRPQNGETKKLETPITLEIPTSNTDDSFGKTATNKKAEIKAKNTEKRDDNNNVHQNDQQLNREAENRKITLNRAGVTRRENLSNNNANQKASTKDNQELTLTNQPKSIIIPTTKETQTKKNNENNSENKQGKEETNQRVTTEQPTTRRQNNGRKIKIGRRVLVRTAPKKISKNEEESAKTIDSEQSKTEVKPTTSRRTLISNRQTPRTNRNNKQENSKSTDSVQSRKEAKPSSSRRTLISNRQSPQKISNNEQDISKSTDSAQSRQNLQPTANRRTILNTRQTGSRRARPTASSTKDSTRKETNQEDSDSSNRSGSKNRGRRIKQTVRRVISDNTQQESVKVPTITTKEQTEVLPKQRISISNKPVTEQISSVASKIENNDKILKVEDRDQAKSTSDVKTGPLNPDKTPSYLPSGQLNTDKTPSYLPLGPLNTNKTPSNLPFNKDDLKLFLDSTASQIIEDLKNKQNNLKVSEQEEEKSKDKTETKSPQETDENTDATDAHDNNQNPSKIAKVTKINKNTKEIEGSPSNTNNPNKTRTRSRTTVPISVTGSRNIAITSTGEDSATSSSRTRSRTTVPISVTGSRNTAITSTGEDSATTSSRTRSRSRSRSSSRTRNQDATLQEETISTATTNRGTSRSGRIESFGSKDVSKSSANTSPVTTENTSRRITRRRGRQPT